MEVFRHMVTSYFFSFEQMRKKEEYGNYLTQSSKRALKEYYVLFCCQSLTWYVSVSVCIAEKLVLDVFLNSLPLFFGIKRFDFNNYMKLTSPLN